MANNFKKLKASKFIKMLPARQERFESAKAELPTFSDNATALAKALHPKMQYLKIKEVIVRSEDTKSFVLVPDTEKGTTSLAYFGAGKYLTVFEKIDGMPITRAYSISSSPKDSLKSFSQTPSVIRSPRNINSSIALCFSSFSTSEYQVASEHLSSI